MNSQRIYGRLLSGAGAGARPLHQATVTLYEATEREPRRLGSGMTDHEGNFGFDLAASSSGGTLYAVADVRTGVVLATVIGSELPESITINELTTVAAGFAMAQFTVDGQISGDPFALRIAAGMNHNLVAIETGESSPVMLTSPNGDETNSLRSTRALANLLAGCVRDVPGALPTVRSLTTPPHGHAPVNTFQAIVNIARNPGNNVNGIYEQAKVLEIYLPALEMYAPSGNPVDAWTIAVKVNDSGIDSYLFGGPANIAFDEKGYAWVANNVMQGTPNSATCIMVLRPDGKPADGENGEPRSPVFGGGIFGVGFGVGIAPDGHVWIGNFGWGDPDTQYPVNGTVTELNAKGQPLSPPQGYTGSTDRVQGVAVDGDGNVWLASFGNNALTVFPGGRPHSAYTLTDTSGDDPLIGTFGIAVSGPAEAWVSYCGGLGWPLALQKPAYVCRYRFGRHGLTQLSKLQVGSVTKGIGLDSRDHAWVGSGGDDTVYRITPDGTAATGYQGGGISGPWSVAVDGDDNVWVANFGPMGPVHDYTNAGVSKLAGPNPLRGYSTGDPISPPTGYTLPTAGEQVRLHDGRPLNGVGGEPCFSPLMRMTSVNIDAAGNLWAVNNWKPDFATDFLPDTGNPGGDGIVIFVGVAAPPRTRA